MSAKKSKKPIPFPKSLKLSGQLPRGHDKGPKRRLPGKPRTRDARQEAAVPPAVAKRFSYYVTTWDEEKQTFTPLPGVRTGPYSLFGLRKALRMLAGMGYDTGRDATFVFVQRREVEKLGTKKVRYPLVDWMETPEGKQ